MSSSTGFLIENSIEMKSFEGEKWFAYLKGHLSERSICTLNSFFILSVTEVEELEYGALVYDLLLVIKNHYLTHLNDKNKEIFNISEQLSVMKQRVFEINQMLETLFENTGKFSKLQQGRDESEPSTSVKFFKLSEGLSSSKIFDPSFAEPTFSMFNSATVARNKESDENINLIDC